MTELIGLLTGIIGLVMLFAQLKLFSINKSLWKLWDIDDKLGKILKELQEQK